MVIPGFLQQPGVPTFSHPCLKHEHEHGREPDEHEHLSSTRLTDCLHLSRAGLLPALHCNALRENRPPPCLLVPIKGTLSLRGGESHQTQTQTTDHRQTQQPGNSIKLGGAGRMSGWMDWWMGKATSRWEGEWRPALVH